MRALVVALALLTMASTAFAQPGPGPGPRPGGGPSGPGPGPKGPSGPGGPGGPGGAGRPDPVEQRRKMQELRAARLAQVVKNDAQASKLTQAMNQHDEKQQGYSDEKSQILQRIEAVLHGLLEAKVTAIKKDEVMLSAGSDELVGPGFVFNIRHGGQAIAKVVVDKVTNDTCLCKVVSVEAGAKIQKDDAAQFAGIDGGGGGDKAAKSDKKDKPEDLPALLEKVADIEKQMRSSENDLAKTIREILPAPIAAKVILFLQKFQEELKQGGPPK